MKVKFNNENLIPVIIQDYLSLQVLMLGYMNQEALDRTLEEKTVIFFSRSRKKLWKKGETSGNFLLVKSYFLDCDLDTILIQVSANGPTCHKGKISCFNYNNFKNINFIYKLEEIIKNKILTKNIKSYTSELIKKGINKVIQKVGEESVELIIEAKDQNNNLFLNEAADLLYHYLILLQIKNFNLKDVEKILEKRNFKKNN